MYIDDPEEKLEKLLTDILRPFPDLYCFGIGIHDLDYDFRISSRRLKTFTNFSRHLAEDEIDIETVVAEFNRLIKDGGWTLEPVIPTKWVSPLNFEQLIQAIRVLSEGSGFEFIRVVVAGDDPLFIEVDSPNFRSRIEQAIQDRLLVLGLLGWKMDDQMMQRNVSTILRHFIF